MIKIKALLAKFFFSLGKNGAKQPSRHGAYEPPVPEWLKKEISGK